MVKKYLLLFLLVFSLMIVSVNGAVFDGVLHYWDFNSSTNLVNTTGNFAAGEGTMSYSTTNALIGNAGRFTTNQNLNIPAGVVTMVSPNTWNFWIRGDDPSLQQFWVYGGTANTHMGWNTGTQWFIEGKWFGDGTNYDAGAAVANTWHMVTIVSGDVTSNNGTVYIDGVNVASNANANDIDATVVRWLGRHSNGGLELQGYMDEMGYWGRALSNSEIQSLYNSGSGITYEAPATNSINMTISYPNNEEYIINITSMNFTADHTGADITCWYSLDLGVTNTTTNCSENITGLGSVEGLNTWIMFMNNTVGDVDNDTVTFRYFSPPTSKELFYDALLYYNFNDSTELVSGVYNLTTTRGDVFYETNGSLIGKSIHFGGNAQTIINNNSLMSMSGGNKSYSIWLNYTSIDIGNDQIIDDHYSNTKNAIFIGVRVLSKIYVGTGIGTAPDLSFPAVPKVWHNVIVSYNDTGSTIYLNGVKQLTVTGINTYDSIYNLSMGDYDFTTENNPMTGNLDEFVIFNRSLNIGDVQTLYNSGLGITYEPPEYVNVTIVYPLKYVNYTINVTDLNYTYSYNSYPPSNCWYSLDNGLTNTTITCGNNVTGLTSQEENNTWTVYVNNTDGLISSDSVTFNKDTIFPVVTLNTPTNDSHQNGIVNYTASFSDATGLQNATLFIWDSNDTLINQTSHNFTTVPTSYDLGIEVNISDGDYYWGYYTSDTTGHQTFSENWTVTIDNVLPEIKWYNPIKDSNPITSIPLFEVNASVSDLYLDRVNLTVYDKNGLETYNNYTENLTITKYWFYDNITLSEGENIIEVCGSDSLAHSKPISISDRKDFKKKSEEETVFEMKDKRNRNKKYNITRKVTIRDNKGHKINPNSLRLRTTDKWIDNNKHYKTIWEFDDTKVDSFEIVMNDEGKGLEILTDRGVTRIVDKDRTYYWRYDDMEAMGYKLQYKKQGGEIIIIVKKGVGVGESNGKWILDPLVGLLNTNCENQTVYLDTQVGYAQSGGYNGSGTTPVNNTVINTSYTNFTLNASDISGIKNATLVIVDENDTLINQTTIDTNNQTSGFWGFVEYLLYEGIYKWYYIVYDTLNHMIQTTISTITFTKSLPTLSINYPTNTVYDTEITGLNYSTDSNNTCWYSTDNGITNSTNITAGINWTTEPTSIPYGSNTWTVWCLSFENKSNKDSVMFTTNTSYVYVNINDPLNQSYFKEFTYNDTRIDLTFNYTLNSSYGLNKCWYILENSDIDNSNYTNVSGFENGNDGWTLHNVTNSNVSRYESSKCQVGDWCLNFTGNFLNENGANITINKDLTNVDEICYQAYNIENYKYTNLWVDGVGIKTIAFSSAWNTTLCKNISESYNGTHEVKIDVSGHSFLSSEGSVLIDNITFFKNRKNYVSCSDNNITISTPYGSSKLNLYAKNVNNLTNYSYVNYNYDYTLSVNNHTYTNPVYETSNQLFTSNVTYDSTTWNAIFGYVVYNSTSYLTTKTVDGNNVKFERNITTPIFPSSNFSTFYWSFVLNNITGTFTYNDTTYTQDIERINLTDCNDDGLITLNFTLKNENTFDIMNGSLEATFLYGGTQYSSVIRNYTYKYIGNNKSSFPFCISPNESIFYVNSTISYYQNDFDRREYFMVNTLINNITQNISLYLLGVNTTDLFTLTVLDENNRPVENAYIRVQRWDIGTDLFYTIGMIITDEVGKATINLRLTDEWYRYQVIYNETLYLTTEPHKEGTNERLLHINLLPGNPYDEFENIDYSLTFNNLTNITTFTYADTTGAASTGCLKITKITPTTTEVISYQCVESTSGVISTYINDTGTFSIQAVVILTKSYGSVQKIVDNLMKDIGTPERFTKLESYGQFISLMLIGTAAFIGVSTGSIPLGLLLISVTFVGVNLLGWLNISSTILFSIISIIILIAFTLRRKRG